MSTIKILKPEIASQIAAGEVIERPAYAVKELIENAIDARANKIRIDLNRGGLSLIKVTDNGMGMDKDDLLMCFMPHATSKLSKQEDLHHISTLGFRGEALSSISSISHISIASKKGTTGYMALLEYGKLISVEKIGMPVGTSISIVKIFDRLPARKKFFKSERTEFRRIVEIVSDFALSYPDIEFILNHNNKEYFAFTKYHTLERRIQTLLGDSLFVNLLPINYENSFVKLSGFIARPQYSVKGTSKIFTFVNKRRVYNSLISLAIKDSYKNLLEYGGYPIAILNINIPHEYVDVNIHPRKEEVRFYDSENVYTSIVEGITQTLNQHNLTFFNVSWKDAGTKTHLGRLLKYELLSEMDTMKKGTKVLQVHNLYLITETEKGVLLIDQHAAHEAILFRKLKDNYKKLKNNDSSEILEKPKLLSLSLSDLELLTENRNLFMNMGITFEDFGGKIRVVSIPKLIHDRDIEDTITEILEDIRLNKKTKDIDTRTYRMLSYLACRSAIKGGTSLTDEESKKLIEDLQAEDLVYTCPHGRPVKIELSLTHLDKMFKR